MIVTTPLAAFTVVVLGLGLAALLLLLGALLYEVWVVRRQQRSGAVAALYEEAVAQVVAGERSARGLLELVRSRDRAPVARLLLSYAQLVQVAPEQATLLTLFRSIGAVEGALRQSRDWRWWVRAGAARQLGQMRDPLTLNRLKELLQERHAEVRTAALWAILQLPVEPSVDLMERMVARGGLVSGLRVATLFLDAGRRVVPALSAFLAAVEVVEVPAEVLLLAGELHAFASEPALLMALRAPNPSVRQAGCQALGRLESPNAFAGLVAALGDPAWPVRAAAAEALGRIGDPAALAPLRSALAEPNPTALLAIASALGRLGPAGASALQALAATLPSEQRLQRQILAEVLSEVVPS